MAEETDWTGQEGIRNLRTANEMILLDERQFSCVVLTVLKKYDALHTTVLCWNVTYFNTYENL